MLTNLEFRGRWLDMYGNLILIAIFSGLTAGLYAPWGYARWQRIITENTYFEGQQLEFDGSGAEVFWQFIIIGFYTLITLGLYIILGFSSTRMLRWQYAHTLMPNGQRMDYQGKTLDIFWEWLLLVLFTPLTLGLYYYWGRNRLRRRILTNVILDERSVQFESAVGEDFLAVSSNWVLTVIAVGVYGALGFFLRSRVQAIVPPSEQLGSIGAGLPVMDLVNLLLSVVAQVVYILLGLALLGLATVRLRGWEVNRTLLPTPVRSRTPRPVIATPASAPPPDAAAFDSGVDGGEAVYAEYEPPRTRDSDYGGDARPRAHAGQEDEYYNFADYSTHAGQEAERNSGDDRTDWSGEQWARPQSTPMTDETETERRHARHADDAR